jgi:predicted acylesterase/phospholipase RssA
MQSNKLEFHSTKRRMPLEHGTLPRRNCDLVMKGGITSGVVYPYAVVEIARAFRLRNVGGTSAGAIAAAAAAAAECGRTRGRVDACDELEQLPTFLASKVPGESRTHLFALFQPQPDTQPIFNTCVSALGGGGSAPLRVLGSLLMNFWVAAVGGALPGVVAMFVARAIFADRARSLALALSAGLLITGAIVAAMIAFAVAVVTRLPENGFGLCSGLGRSEGTDAPPLTVWLAGYLDGLAGSAPTNPLTFGDLAAAGVNLEVMTTCLTHGRPYRLPFREDEFVKEGRVFYFREDELRTLFPKGIVDWMLAHPRDVDIAAEQNDERARFAREGYFAMPDAEHLPVVVAARMSLSFPILLSAVPLHAIDRSRTAAEARLERCWFSDGGISSNFPVHFFDAVLPRWPTFAIDLTEKHPDFPTGVYMPRSNQAGTLVKWYRFDSGSPLRRLIGFLAQILTSAKDWVDNAQARLPGYRDRIAQIALGEHDGGLNLDMPREQIDRLAEYGREAGREFVRRFASADPHEPMGWENHRRIRLRTALSAIEEWLTDMEVSASTPAAGDLSYDAVIADPNPASYPWSSGAQQQLAATVLRDLRTLGRMLESSEPNDRLRHGSPKPLPELRMRPRI